MNSKLGDTVWFLDGNSARAACFLTQEGSVTAITLAGNVWYAEKGIFPTKEDAQLALNRCEETHWIFQSEGEEMRKGI